MPTGRQVGNNRAKNSGKNGYGAIEHIVERRGGPKTVLVGDKTFEARKYHLTAKELSAKLEGWHKARVFRSPYARGVLSDFLNALSDLGVNEIHSGAAVQNQMMKIMSVETENKATTRVRNGVSDWDRFEDRPSKWTMPKRIACTALSLRKTKSASIENCPKGKEPSIWLIGRKLEQMGCCVDIVVLETPDIGDEEQPPTLHYRLNTYSSHALKMDVQRLEQFPKVNFGDPTLGPRKP
jgi:hypothetical protein